MVIISFIHDEYIMHHTNRMTFHATDKQTYRIAGLFWGVFFGRDIILAPFGDF